MASVWDALIGQAAAQQHLRAVLVAGRLAHGYLFAGPEGVGKRTAALLLARILLCHQPPAPDEACGQCKSCRRLAAARGLVSSHPDLLFPVKFNSKGEPLDRPVADHEPLLPLPSLRQLGEQVYRTPSQGPRRVAVIPEAHRMCAGQGEAGNAFLKTLEEPPASTILILTSSRPEGLLETIVSRLQPVRFFGLSEAELKRGLSGQKRLPAAELELAAALAGGSLGRALELACGDLGRWREKILAELGRFGPSNAPGFGLSLWQYAVEEGNRLAEAGEASGSGGEEAPAGAVDEEEAARTEAGWQRHVFQRLLELCGAVFRDGLLAASGVGEAATRGAPEKAARELAARFGAGGCMKVLEFLREARTAVRLYVRGDLVGRVLAGRMREALRSG